MYPRFSCGCTTSEVVIWIHLVIGLIENHVNWPRELLLGRVGEEDPSASISSPIYSWYSTDENRSQFLENCKTHWSHPKILTVVPSSGCSHEKSENYNKTSHDQEDLPIILYNWLEPTARSTVNETWIRMHQNVGGAWDLAFLCCSEMEWEGWMNGGREEEWSSEVQLFEIESEFCVIAYFSIRHIRQPTLSESISRKIEIVENIWAHIFTEINLLMVRSHFALCRIFRKCSGKYFFCVFHTLHYSLRTLRMEMRMHKEWGRRAGKRSGESAFMIFFFLWKKREKLSVLQRKNSYREW